MRHPEKPAGCTEINTYGGFRWNADGWLRRTLGNLIVVGPTSQGKTETIRGVCALSSPPLMLQGVQSPTSVFMTVQQWVVVLGNDGPIIIDDADSLFQSLAGQSMMKELILDKPNRTVSHGTEYAGLKAANLAKSFTMSNPVAVILNKWRTFNEHLAAVKSRGRLVYVNFSAQEVHNYVGTWFLKRPRSQEAEWADEVYTFVGRFLPLMQTPNIREMYEEPLKELITEKKLGRPNPEGGWQRQFLKRAARPSDKMLESALLFASDDYKSNAERARAYEAAGHGSARTFYRHIADWKLISDPSHRAALEALEAEEQQGDVKVEKPPLDEDALDRFLSELGIACHTVR